MKRREKIYGLEETHLKLTAKAEQFFDETDPCIIIEYKTEDGYRYDIKEPTWAFDLTEKQVSQCFEELKDIYAEADAKNEAEDEEEKP